MVTYEVRQKVSTIKKTWLEVVFSCSYERPARMTYETCKAEHPESYFELVKIEASEECMEFTKAA